MKGLFTKESFSRLTPDERSELMALQMSPSSSGYGGWNMPEDCSECGACGTPMLGSGWCDFCYGRWDALTRKALPDPEAEQ